MRYKVLKDWKYFCQNLAQRFFTCKSMSCTEKRKIYCGAKISQDLSPLSKKKMRRRKIPAASFNQLKRRMRLLPFKQL